jgi:beta-glucosidase
MKVSLQAGETRHVSVPLDTRAFAYYDVTSGNWQAPAGKYRVLVGKSSEEIALSGDINLATTAIEKP